MKMKIGKYYMVLSMLLLSVSGFAQQEILKVDQVDNAENIGYYCQVFIDSLEKSSINHIITEDYKPSREPDFLGNYFFTFVGDHENNYRIYLETANESPDSTTIYFCFGRFLDARLYIYDINKSTLQEVGLRDTFIQNENFIFQVTFPPESQCRIWCDLGKKKSAIVKPVYFVVGKSFDYISEYTVAETFKGSTSFHFTTTSILLFLGFLLSMLTFSLVYSILTRKKVFVFYFLYIFTTIAYFFHHHFDFTSLTLFSEQISFLRDLTWQPLSYLMYFIFVIYFVDFKRLCPSLYNFMRIMIVLISLYLIFDLVLHFNSQFRLRALCYNYFRIVMGPVAIFTIVAAFFLKDKLALILATGSLFMVAGAIITLVLAIGFSNTGNPWLDYHMIYMYLGTAIETIFFAIGLGYKNRLSDRAILKAETDLIIERKKSELTRLQTIIDTQNNERERVSLELHDDLGSGLASIKMLSESAKHDQNTYQNLNRISQLASEISDNMRQIIWSMNPANYTLPQLLMYIRGYSSQYLEWNKIQLSFILDTTLPEVKLSHTQVRNIILVVKELLHNVVKHAKADEVIINVHYASGVLDIHLNDNGIGFNNVDSLPSQHGIRSIGKRISGLSGTFQIERDHGTQVILKIPI